MIHDARPSKLQPNALLPDSSIGNTFASLFPYGFNWIYSKSEKIDWKTETRYPLTPRTLWDKFQDTRQVIGVRFGQQTEYAMLDIDRKSPYHPFNSIANYDLILKAMASIGLDGSICIRSSGSEGIHLYFPLEHQVNSFKLACAVRFALEAHRLEIANGVLETFPNTKGYDCEFNAHRLPLQNGSYILRDDFYPLTNKVERFVERWLDVAECQDLELLLDKMEVAKKLHKPKFNKSAKINDWKQELETIISQGWTSHGETNQILFKVCEYARVFLGFADLDKIVNWVTDTVTQMKGFKQFSNHQADLLKRVRDWSKWALSHRYPMQDKQSKEDMQTNKRQTNKEATIQRIKDVANSMYDRNQVSTVRDLANTIAKQAGCSVSTLYKNLSLWHPEHRCVTVAIIDNTAELEAVTHNEQSTKNGSLTSVTQITNEVLGRDCNQANSSKFVPSGFQPLPENLDATPEKPENRTATPAPAPAPAKFFDNIKIKLLETKIANRRSGRISSEVLLEIEQLEREIKEIRNKNCVT